MTGDRPRYPSGMAEALKEMFNGDVVRRIAMRVKGAYGQFDVAAFERPVLAELPELNLLARAKRIAQGLHDGLPSHYEKAVRILIKALGAPAAADAGMGRFADLPFVNFVGLYGVAHPEVSLDALEEMTKHFSAEWDIRPFLIHHETMTLARIHEWTGHADWRVRRLATEGTRPRLPWGVRLEKYVKDPRPTLKILEKLKGDPHANVRNSVANHLNDIAKDNPEIAVKTAMRWNRSPDARTRWIVRHAMRSLVKRGDQRAIALLGFSTSADVRLVNLKLAKKQVTLGTGVDFGFALRVAAGEANVVVDYCIHHVKANGKRSGKVFKLGRRRLAAGRVETFERRHAIVPISTRKYYAGAHRVEILVNGKVVGGADFELVA